MSEISNLRKVSQFLYAFFKKIKMYFILFLENCKNKFKEFTLIRF